jgi:hypothetical protein
VQDEGQTAALVALRIAPGITCQAAPVRRPRQRHDVVIKAAGLLAIGLGGSGQQKGTQKQGNTAHLALSSAQDFHYIVPDFPLKMRRSRLRSQLFSRLGKDL